MTAYRDRPPWKLSAEEAGTAVIEVSADATWLVERRYGAYGEFEELADGSARFTTPYSDLAALSAWILSLGGRAHAVEPEAVVEAVAADLQTVIDAHSGEPRAVPAAPGRGRGRARPSPPPRADAGAGRARAVRAPPGAPGLPARPLRRRGLRAASRRTSSSAASGSRRRSSRRASTS